MKLFTVMGVGSANTSIKNLSESLKIYLVDGTTQYHSWAQNGIDKKQIQLKILLSYWYFKNIDLDELFAKYFTKPYPIVFADSGAFSAMTQGVEITLDDYAKWVIKWKHLFTTYANFDVIKDAEKTLENQLYLEDIYGLEPLPTFHVLEDFKWLEYYVKRYPYIALGVAGMQQRRVGLMKWLLNCFSIAKDTAVFHGFGLTSWQVMKSFKWYSVDSSSWTQGFQYGQVPVFDERQGRFIKLPLGNYEKWRLHSRLIHHLGFNPLDFAERKRNDRRKICAISALSYMLAERWLQRYHGPVIIPHNHQIGFRNYLADTSNGINWGDADLGVKSYLGEVNTSLRDIRSIKEQFDEDCS